jgi:hypothetical protein
MHLAFAQGAPADGLEDGNADENLSVAAAFWNITGRNSGNCSGQTH